MRSKLPPPPSKLPRRSKSPASAQGTQGRLLTVLVPPPHCSLSKSRFDLLWGLCQVFFSSLHKSFFRLRQARQNPKSALHLIRLLRPAPRSTATRPRNLADLSLAFAKSSPVFSL
ncbi:hypothetical protein F2Q69_00030989 [Brassica cretica]|uniref:Uncharacterized protein n=1 Tax=Brassica cretica TaxID=69181 RepID=A0A8S9RVF9_BRACR|nr:hypothetical protein F2Q69_00030989 [Brassica cretica]